DTTLEIGRRLFQVSRAALSRHSRYFEAMFFGGTRESSEKHIVIRGVEAETFQVLLEFTRSATVLIMPHNVTRLLETADFLQFERVKRMCEKFLERELHVSNCLSLMAYAQCFACAELHASALSVALTHWTEVITQEEFEMLPKDTLLELLQSDDLFVPREDVVFETVLKWIMHDPATREQDFLDLMGQVRVTFLSLSFLDILVKQSKHPGEKDPSARLLEKLNRCPPLRWRSMELSPGTSRSYETLYVLGGKHDKEQQELFQFQPKTGTWHLCSPLQRRNLIQYAVAAVGPCLFVTGGYFREEFAWHSVDWVLVYNSWDNSWQEGPALKQSRNSHWAPGAGAILYDEKGDVYGGVQRLDVEKDVWDVISVSPLPRYDLSVTALNGALYTIGGGAFRFDMDTDEWTRVDEECLTPKFFLGCCTVNGQIYLLAQRQGNVALPN
uniref:BTB domain-containing protein n=1 Tax=Pelodiscus sinensis TaxID=13735 RepID=K7GEM6_PELSI